LEDRLYLTDVGRAGLNSWSSLTSCLGMHRVQEVERGAACLLWPMG
jgi:hypothetical protein